MLKHLRSKTSMTISLIIVFLFSMTGTVFGKANTPSVSYDYVSLGDSLAAGQTPYGNTDSYGYTNILADKLASAGVLGSYGDYGVSGYTTKNVLNQLTTRPDIIAALSKAEIVTLDIGANDIIPQIPNLIANPNGANAIIAPLIINIGTIIYTIKSINPNAKIYVMGYYNAFVNYLNPAQQAAFLPLLTGFNTALETMVTNPAAYGLPAYYGAAPEYVNTMVTMDKHLTAYLPVVDIHPTVQGYRAIAGEFWKLIQVDFLRGLN